MQDANRTYNELVTNQPSVERGSPHIWLFSALQKTMEKTLTNKIGNRGFSHPDRVKVYAL